MAMNTVRRFRRFGFSLIELLIVVAIIAALVGVAVPMFQKNIAEAHRAKAMQDLDTIRNAITLHDSQNRPLVGTSLKPLLGRYLQDIPKDPWGNDYLLDAGVGIIVSFGGDQKAGPGTSDEDEDLQVRYKADLRIQSVKLEGAWGRPVGKDKDNTGYTKLRVQFNKPLSFDKASVVLTPPGNVADQFELISDPKATSFKKLSELPAAFVTDSSDANVGIIVFAASVTPSSGTTSELITASCAVNVTSGCTKIFEQYTAGGPLDKGLYGSGVLEVKAAQPIDRVGSENRGVPIARYN